MSKRIEIGGKFYRKRRGELVEIPPEWVGQTLHPQTKRKRLSRTTGKVRRRCGGYQGEFHPHQHPANQAPRHSVTARNGRADEVDKMIKQGIDPHLASAAQMLNRDYAELAAIYADIHHPEREAIKQARQVCKRHNFGLDGEHGDEE